MSTTTANMYIPAAQRFVTLIDPAYKAGMLQIPLEKTYETKGRNEWLKGTLRKDLSLCCLFQKGRCHAEDRCHQVHVERVYMESLRAQQAKIVSCCAQCNDTASLTPAALNFFASNFGCATRVLISSPDCADVLNEIGADRLAYTIGLTAHMEQTRRGPLANVVVLPGKKVCRLHLRGCCKYGKDCKNLHLCSKLTEDVLIAKPSSLSAAVLFASAVASAAPAPVTHVAYGKAVAARPVFPTSFAERALPQPVCYATPAPAPAPMPRWAPAPASSAAAAATVTPAPIAPRPMPTFSLFARNDVAEEKGSLHLSCSQGQLDAIDVNDNSGRLSGIIFDPKRALEDSHRAAALRFDFNSTMWMGATSPGQKRRGSGSSNGTTATYDDTNASTSNDWNPLTAAGPAGAGPLDFLRVFA